MPPLSALFIGRKEQVKILEFENGAVAPQVCLSRKVQIEYDIIHIDVGLVKHDKLRNVFH